MVPGAVALGERDNGEDGDDGCCGSEGGGHEATPPDRTSELFCGAGSGGVDVVEFGGGQGEGGGLGPGLELGEAAAGREEPPVPVVFDPFADLGGEAAVGTHVLSIGFDPAPETGPFPEQGLVGHLDGGSTGVGVAVERQQALPSEAVQYMVQRRRVDGQAGEFFDRYSAAKVFGIRGNRHQAQEHLPGCFPLGGVRLEVRVIGPPRERTRDAAAGPIGVQRQRVTAAVLEQFRQRVLQQRQSGGP